MVTTAAHRERCPHQKCPGGSLCCCTDQAATRTRVVATVTELDALPVGSVVIALAGGASWQKMPDGLWAGVLGTRDSRGIRERGYLPARVLYDPEESAPTPRPTDPAAYRPVERFGAEGGRLLPGSVDTHTDTPEEDTEP